MRHARSNAARAQQCGTRAAMPMAAAWGAHLLTPQGGPRPLGLGAARREDDTSEPGPFRTGALAGRRGDLAVAVFSSGGGPARRAETSTPWHLPDPDQRALGQGARLGPRRSRTPGPGGSRRPESHDGDVRGPLSAGTTSGVVPAVHRTPLPPPVRHLKGLVLVASSPRSKSNLGPEPRTGTLDRNLGPQRVQGWTRSALGPLGNVEARGAPRWSDL